ncbi:hypothetical protein V6N13_027183 [Hibiscus sabdariffa]
MVLASVNKSCSRCRRTLSASNLASHLQLGNYSTVEGVLYCKPYFEQLFKETVIDVSICIGFMVVALQALQIMQQLRAFCIANITFPSFSRRKEASYDHLIKSASIKHAAVPVPEP